MKGAEAAVEVFEGLEDPPAEIALIVQAGLFNGLLKTGRLEEALSAGLAASKFSKGVGVHEEASIERSLGTVLHALGRHEEALIHLERAVDLGRENNGLLVAMCLSRAGLVNEELHNYDVALEQFQESYDIARELKVPGYAGFEPGAGLARMQARKGKLSDATMLVEELERLGAEDPLDQAMIAESRGYILTLEGNRRGGSRAYGRAIDFYRLGVEADPGAVESFCRRVPFDLPDCEAHTPR